MDAQGPQPTSVQLQEQVQALTKENVSKISSFVNTQVSLISILKQQ